jgi:hypothetical protein
MDDDFWMNDHIIEAVAVICATAATAATAPIPEELVTYSTTENGHAMRVADGTEAEVRSRTCLLVN